MDRGNFSKGAFEVVISHSWVVISHSWDVFSVGKRITLSKDQGGDGILGSHSWFEDSEGNRDYMAWHKLELTNKTMEDLKYGDIIINGGRYEKKVLANLGNGVYVLSDMDSFDSVGGTYTSKELDENGWKVKSEEEVEELTVEEVSKRLGKTVKIVK